MTLSDQRATTPPAEVFNADTVTHHLLGLADQVGLFQTQNQNQNQNQATLDQILAAVQATNDRMDAMETRVSERMDGIKASIIEHIDTVEERMNNQFCALGAKDSLNLRQTCRDKLESLAINDKARAKNTYACVFGTPYTPLVKEDGAAIRNFPRTFDEVNALNDPGLSTLLQAVGVELEDNWTVEKKRKVFLAAIGVVYSPNL